MPFRHMPSSPDFAEAPKSGVSVHASCGSRCGRLHRLPHLEAFELRMIEIERLVVAGATVGGAKLLRPGPGLERRAALPHRVRGIERVIVVLRSFQQVELDKARHLLQMRVTAHPPVLAILLTSLPHAEAIHGDEHRASPSVTTGHT